MKIIITLDDTELTLFKMLRKIKDSTSEGHSMPVVLDKGEMDEETVFLDGDGDFFIRKLEIED